ncbi:MAG: hypothetical protein ABR522_06955 [Marinobacter sp.]
MKTIHKFRLECGKEANTLKLREGYRVVRCEYVVPQKGVYLWVEQPLNVTVPVVERQFVVVYSGDPVPVSYQYLDTALDPFGPEAYHIFEVAEASAGQAVAPNRQTTPMLFHSARRQVGTA